MGHVAALSTPRACGDSTLFGLGVFLVGVFPGNTGGTHTLVALLAFVFSGATAVTALKVTASPFRWMSLGMGAVSLVSLVIGELGESSVVARSIGLGGGHGLTPARLRPIAPAMTSPIETSFAVDTASPSAAMPTIAVPVAPSPVQTA